VVDADMVASNYASSPGKNRNFILYPAAYTEKQSYIYLESKSTALLESNPHQMANRNNVPCAPLY